MKYGQHKIIQLKNAEGVKGVLLTDAKGDIFFRVYESDKSFKDYDLRHSDLEVTIHGEAAFYELEGEKFVLDHSPQVLGIDEVGK